MSLIRDLSLNSGRLKALGQVNVDQIVMTSQVGINQSWVKSDKSKKNFEPKILWAQILFGTKMHLRMEFDSGVGPTCFTLLFLLSPSAMSKLRVDFTFT